MKLGLIGGSLLPGIKMQQQTVIETVETPYGKVSANFISGKIDKLNCVYINRHGDKHHLAPHEINYRANIWLAKQLGVTDIISLTAVGGITKKMLPMHCVLPNQLIDYSYARAQSYQQNSQQSIQHIDFSYPFDAHLISILKQALLQTTYPFEEHAVYGVTQGPRLETIAEINRMQQDGCDIVGMTAMPEASLARELAINYATLSIVVNWAAGKGEQNNKAGISMAEIHQRIKQANAITTQLILKTITLLLP